MDSALEVTPGIVYRSPRGEGAFAVTAVTCATAIAIGGGAVLSLHLFGQLGPGDVRAPVRALLILPAVLEATLVPAAVASWAVRCRRNLGLLPDARYRWSAAWMACGWFIPVAGLVLPLLCLWETWSASAGRRPPILLLPWWVLWAVRALPVLLLIMGPAALWPSTLEVTLIALYVGAAVLSAAGAVLVVLRLTHLQSRRLRPVQLSSGQIPTWGRTVRPPRAMAAVACISILLAALGGAVMLAANTVSLALGSYSLVFGPRELIVAWRVGLAACGLFGLVVGTVLTALWASRAYRNLPALGASPLDWSPGWAAASWFIPVANLAVPYLVVRDAWPGPTRGLLRLWWATLLTSLALGIISGLLHLSTADLTQLAGDVSGLAGDLALLPAGLLAVVVITRVTRHQVAMARNRS